MDTAKRVIRVQQQQDRFNERIPIGAKSSIDRKVSGKDTKSLTQKLGFAGFRSQGCFTSDFGRITG